MIAPESRVREIRPLGDDEWRGYCSAYCGVGRTALSFKACLVVELLGQMADQIAIFGFRQRSTRQALPRTWPTAAQRLRAVEDEREHPSRARRGSRALARRWPSWRPRPWGYVAAASRSGRPGPLGTPAPPAARGMDRVVVVQHERSTPLDHVREATLKLAPACTVASGITTWPNAHLLASLPLQNGNPSDRVAGGPWMRSEELTEAEGRVRMFRSTPPMDDLSGVTPPS